MLNKKGFTLIELLVVVGIMATLLSIAVIAGRAAMDKNNVEALIKAMNADFLNAKVSAMQKNRMYFAVLTPAQYTILRDTDPAADGDGIPNPALDTVVSQINIDPRYALTIDAGAGQINFDPRGLATTGALPYTDIGTLLGAQVNIRVTTPYNAALDCITVSATKVRMGVWDGATCNAQ